MTRSTTIHSRVEPGLKKNVEAIFAKLGISTSQAIALFLKQVELQKGLPIELKIPNAETAGAMRELDKANPADAVTLEEYTLHLNKLQAKHGVKNTRK